jgi:hypothetical protein
VRIASIKFFPQRAIGASQAGDLIAGEILHPRQRRVIYFTREVKVSIGEIEVERFSIISSRLFETVGQQESRI